MPLTPRSSESERGVGPWEPLTAEERRVLDTGVPAESFTILQMIIPRLWRPAPLAEMELALEVTDGPYRGVIFGFNNIHVLPDKLDNGFVPAKFGTRIFVAPKGFVADEAWDLFAGEVLLAWISYVATHEFHTILTAPPKGSIH